MAQVKIGWFWILVGVGVVYIGYKYFSKKQKEKEKLEVIEAQKALIELQRLQNPTGEENRQLLAVGHLSTELDLARESQRNYINNSGEYLGSMRKNMFWNFADDDITGRGGSTF